MLEKKIMADERPQSTNLGIPNPKTDKLGIVRVLNPLGSETSPLRFPGVRKTKTQRQRAPHLISPRPQFVPAASRGNFLCPPVPITAPATNQAALRSLCPGTPVSRYLRPSPAAPARIPHPLVWPLPTVSLLP